MGQRSRPAVLLTGAESYDRGPPAGGQDLLGPVGCPANSLQSWLNLS